MKRAESFRLRGDSPDFLETRNFRGHEFNEIGEADIGTHPGISCLFDAETDPARRSKLAEELLAHELGHALGLADSSSKRAEKDRTIREALMYAYLHNDGRGARLTADDRAGLRQLYGEPRRIVCQPSERTLCLQKGRFAVEANFYNPYAELSADASAIRSTDVAGFFSFSGPANVDLAVKILNLGGTFKVFYGQLTDFPFAVRVTDTETWEIRTYSPGYGTCGNVAALAIDAVDTTASIGAMTAAAKACKPGPNTLCLLGGRFSAELDWHNQFDDSRGRGRMIRQSDLTGLVYFNDKSNLEMVVKILNAEGTVKIFYAPLSDLEFTLRVTDLENGQTRTYRNGTRESCGEEPFADDGAGDWDY